MEIVTIGVRGGAPKTQTVGFGSLKLRGYLDEIVVDDYEGAGSAYKKRDLQQIKITNNGDTLFDGNKYELFNLLKKYHENRL